MSDIRIVLAEDNLLVRQGLVSLIGSIPGFDVVGAATSMGEASELVAKLMPDVLVTDIRMPPTHSDEGIQVANSYRTERPDLGVLVLSQFVEPAYAIALFDDGTSGRGYLLKDRIDEIDRLADAIRTVNGGGSFIDDLVVDALVRSRTRMVDSPLTGLSARELAVLTEMATGATNAVIAARLAVSAHAIEKHSNSIFAKLGLTEDLEVNRRVKAVLLFLAGPS